MNHYYDKLDDVELDGDELDDALHLQNTEHDGEVEVVDNELHTRRQALIQHFTYSRDTLGKDFEQYR